MIRAGLLALLLVGSAAAQPIPIEPDSDPFRKWRTPSRFVNHIEGMRELLIDGTPSEFETMFACSPIGYSLNSTYRLTFEVKGITVTLSFRRTELPNWRAHKARVAKFTRCARSAARRALRADFPWTPAGKAGPIGRIKASEASHACVRAPRPFGGPRRL